MDVKRHLSIALTVGLLGGVVSGTAGCKIPQGGLMPWGWGSKSSAVSSTPDMSQQKYDGLSQEFASGSGATTALGGKRTAPEQNMFSAAWTKTSTAVGSVFKRKGTAENEDPTSLSSKQKTIGPEVYVAAGRLLENQGKLDEAADKYNQALKVNPNDVNTLISLGRLHDRQGRPTQAMESYRKALKADPQNSMVYNDLGLCFARQQDLQQSITHLNKAVELQGTNAKYRNNLATVLVDANQPEQAYTHLAAVNSPAVAHYNMGYLLSQRGQKAAAAAHLQQALAIEPNMAPASQMLAQLSAPGVQPAQRAPIATAQAPQRPVFTQSPPQSNVAPSYGPPGLHIEPPPVQGGSTGAPGNASPVSHPTTSSGSVRRISHEEVIVAKEIPFTSDRVRLTISDEKESADSDEKASADEPVTLEQADDDEPSPSEPKLLPGFGKEVE